MPTLSAIGMPIHKVAKLEKDIAPCVGRATSEFRAQIDPMNRKFLTAVHVERKVLAAPAPTLSTFDAARTGLIGALGIPPSESLNGTDFAGAEPK